MISESKLYLWPFSSQFSEFIWISYSVYERNDPPIYFSPQTIIEDSPITMTIDREWLMKFEQVIQSLFKHMTSFWCLLIHPHLSTHRSNIGVQLRLASKLWYAGVIMWLPFFIGLMYLIGMWFSEDQRANIIETHVQRRLDYISKYQQLLYTQ